MMHGFIKGVWLFHTNKIMFLSTIRLTCNPTLCAMRVRRVNQKQRLWLNQRDGVYRERKSFIEIYWSLVSLAHFMTLTIF